MTDDAAAPPLINSARLESNLLRLTGPEVTQFLHRNDNYHGIPVEDLVETLQISNSSTTWSR
jgi:hypothetical protein